MKLQDYDTPAMIVRRASRINIDPDSDMEIDIDHVTVIPTIERDSYNQYTLYGKEENGKLYYIVLNQATVTELIACMAELPTHVAYERDKYTELLFDQPVPQDTDEPLDTINRLIVRRYDTAEDAIDWRDDCTCWIWHNHT